MILPLHRAELCRDETDPEDRAQPGTDPYGLGTRGENQRRIIVGRRKELSEHCAREEQQRRKNPVVFANDLFEVKRKDRFHSSPSDLELSNKVDR